MEDGDISKVQTLVALGWNYNKGTIDMLDELWKAKIEVSTFWKNIKLI